VTGRGSKLDAYAGMGRLARQACGSKLVSEVLARMILPLAPTNEHLDLVYKFVTAGLALGDNG